eukprot:scaffold45418_cov74-Phaeocystis_antarctica.AAC.2
MGARPRWLRRLLRRCDRAYRRSLLLCRGSFGWRRRRAEGWELERGSTEHQKSEPRGSCAHSRTPRQRQTRNLCPLYPVVVTEGHAI